MSKYGVAKDCVKNPGDELMWCGCPEWGAVHPPVSELCMKMH